MPRTPQSNLGALILLNMPSRVCACAQMIGAAVHESLRRDRSVGLTPPAFQLAAAPVLFTHSAVTVP